MNVWSSNVVFVWIKSLLINRYNGIVLPQ